MKKKEAKKKTSAIRNNLYFLRLLWGLSPARVALNFLFLLFEFAMWTFHSVIFMQYLFDGENRTLPEAAWFIVFAVTLDIVRLALQARYHNVFVPKTNIRIHYQLNKRLFWYVANTASAHCSRCITPLIV